MTTHQHLLPEGHGPSCPPPIPRRRRETGALQEGAPRHPEGHGPSCPAAFAWSRRGPEGFTLLELILAVTLLVSFLLPMMLIITQSKVRAIKYTQKREMRDLAQRKLFDRVHYYEDKDSGDFAAEGHSNWTWTVPPPEMVGNAEQVLLQYKITVTVPQQIDGGGSVGGTSGEGGSLGSGGSTFEMTLWAFPDERWYEEQDLLYERGQYTPLYGDPTLGGLGY